MIRRLEVAVFAIAFALAGLIACAFLWSGEGPYRDLARANGAERFEFVVPPAGRQETDLETAVSLHGQWEGYVTGRTGEPPRSALPPFTADEYAHMADVRRVFGGAKVVLATAIIVIAIRLQRAWLRRDALRLVRDGAVAAAVGVLVIGIAAAVAFDPLFLLFHEIFFPEGNFLFDPATSNLIRLYPDWYWQGITGLVAGSFIGLAAVVAGTCTLALRKLRTR